MAIAIGCDSMTVFIFVVISEDPRTGKRGPSVIAESHQQAHGIVFYFTDLVHHKLLFTCKAAIFFIKPFAVFVIVFSDNLYDGDGDDQQKH